MWFGKPRLKNLMVSSADLKFHLNCLEGTELIALGFGVFLQKIVNLGV